MLKVRAFLEKRRRRTFEKKITYMCRKKVADARIRYHGRFINIRQAKSILKMDPNESISVDGVKQLLSRMDKEA